ncbi:MAG: prolyl oligopeptidase family serine peptidase, partial [Planctomycetales bacterium]|nr:prolyl oligopeptidase family serine peptidase [Planctomycetales bacterium]
MRIISSVTFVLMMAQLLCADGTKDNVPDSVRPVPPAGIEINATDRAELNEGLFQLGERIKQLRASNDDRVHDLLPDVEIFHRAVDVALADNEYFAPQDVDTAKELLRVGTARAEKLQAGDAPWTTQTGLVVRGYRSKIDQTVQPYGLVIPESYTFSGKDRFRLDIWMHGRGETLSENNFLGQRMKQVGSIAPDDTIVLHPYGRYCNAFKFAGEVDVLEALDHAKQHYRVDDDRVAVRGFSMGGAGCWQMAVHYPGLFFAATPGAGFSETPEFLKSFQQETLSPTWYEQK